MQLQSGQISGAETNGRRTKRRERRILHGQRNCSGYCETKRNETKRNETLFSLFSLFLSASVYIYAAVDKPRLRSSNTEELTPREHVYELSVRCIAWGAPCAHAYFLRSAFPRRGVD